MERGDHAALLIRKEQLYAVLSASELRLDGLPERVQPIAARRRDRDLVAPARNFVVRDKITLVIAFQNGRAGLCQLRDQAVHDRDMILTLRVGAVDDVDEQIRIFQLLKRSAERFDQMVRQLCDKADRVRQQRLTRIGDGQLPRRGVERVEQAVIRRDIRACERVQKRRLARVRIADERHDGQLVFLPPAALLGAGLAHELEIFAQLLDARTNIALIGFQLRFAGASRADAAAETAHFLVPDREPGQIILILCQLDLKLALARFGALGKNIEDERTAVEHGRF